MFYQRPQRKNSSPWYKDLLKRPAAILQAIALSFTKEQISAKVSSKRAAFHRVSKVVCVYFGFELLRSLIGFNDLRHFLNQSEVNSQSQACLAHTRFPALDAGYMHLIRALIRSLSFCVFMTATFRITFGFWPTTLNEKQF